MDHEGSSGATIDGQRRSDAAEGCALSDVSCVGTNNASESNKVAKKKFAKYFCSSSGEVPWQYKVVFWGSMPNS